MKNKCFQMFLWIVTIILLSMILLLPKTVPIHWNISGQIDEYATRYTCIILMLEPIGIYYIMTFIKKIDPNHRKIEQRILTYELMKRILTLFLIALDIFYYYMILMKGSHIQIGICLIIGLFIMIVGNYMPKVPQNFFFGIRTSWTMKNETVWKKTHKVAGYLFVVFGLVVIIAGFMKEIGFIIIMVFSLFILMILCVYSYLEYKKIMN